MAENKNVFYLDLETTGLEPDEGAIILSIGVVFEKLTTKEPQIHEFYGVVAPTENQWKLASQKALDVNGFTWEFLQENGKPFRLVRDDFLRWMSSTLTKTKFAYVGQNPAFDLKFLHTFMGRELDFIGVSFDEVINTQDLYSILVNRRMVPYIGRPALKKICLAVDVEPEPEVHNALEGARAVRRAYKKMLEMGARS